MMDHDAYIYKDTDDDAVVNEYIYKGIMRSANLVRHRKRAKL